MKKHLKKEQEKLIKQFPNILPSQEDYIQHFFKNLQSFIDEHLYTKEQVLEIIGEDMELTKAEADEDWFYGYGNNQAKAEARKRLEDNR